MKKNYEEINQLYEEWIEELNQKTKNLKYPTSYQVDDRLDSLLLSLKEKDIIF